MRSPFRRPAGVTLLGEKDAQGEVAGRSFVDEGTLESEVVDVLGERQSRDRELVLDRAGLLFRDLGFEQVAAEALRPTWSASVDKLKSAPSLA